MKTIHEDPCPQCSGEVVGRTDKIFCTVKCKNHHHKMSKKQNKPMTLYVNDRLLRNLTVLQGLLGKHGTRIKIHRHELQKRGFSFGGCTKADQDSKGRMIWELYYLRYTLGKDGVVTVVRMAHLNKFLPGFFKRWEQEFPKGEVVYRYVRNRLVKPEILLRE